MVRLFFSLLSLLPLLFTLFVKLPLRLLGVGAKALWALIWLPLRLLGALIWIPLKALGRLVSFPIRLIT